MIFGDSPLKEIYSTFSVSQLHQQIFGHEERIKYWLNSKTLSNLYDPYTSINKWHLIGDHFKFMIIAYDLIEDKKR